MRTVRLAAAALVVLGGVAGIASPAQAAASICPPPSLMTEAAAPHVVGNGTERSCTERALRSAVAVGGSISFDCGGPVVIRLAGVLTVDRAAVVDGGGDVRLDAGGTHRVFWVAPGAALSVRRIVLAHGRADAASGAGTAGGAIGGGFRTRIEVVDSTITGSSAAGGGGAVSVGTSGSVAIVRSRLSGNAASFGGAVYTLLAPLTLWSATLTGNRVSAGGDGGAVYTDGAAPRESAQGGLIAVCRSRIVGNTASGGGGGVFLWGYQKDRIVVYRSEFTKNAVRGAGVGLGGGARVGIAPEGGPSRTGSIVLSRVAFLSNSSRASGGALYLDCARTCSIRNTTFSDNRAGEYGGAVYGDGHRDDGVTYVGNRAGQAGGAIAGKRVLLVNSLLSGNSAGNPWGGSLTCTDTVSGSDVLQWGAGAPDDSTPCIRSALRRDPRLGAVGLHGGDVAVALPARDSPVLGRGSKCLPTDARSRARPRRCDLGAAEVAD